MRVYCQWEITPDILLNELEGRVLFNKVFNTFYLRLYGVRHMVKDHSDTEREETCCCHMGYSFRLAASVLLYAPSHRQDSTYHSLCYTSRGALAGTRLLNELEGFYLMMLSTHFMYSYVSVLFVCDGSSD